MKKLFFIFIAALFSANVYGIEKGPCNEITNVCCDQYNDTFSFNYPKDLGAPCPISYEVYTEFLYMKPIEDGLQYAVFNNTEGPIFTFPLENGQVVDFSNEDNFNPGFRIGLGYFFNHDNWNLDLNWTYLNIKADSEKTINDGFLLPIFLSTDLIEFQEKTASARWSGNFNRVDSCISKSYHISRYFISKPTVGLSACWICQDLHARYFPITTYEFDAFTKVNVFFKNDFTGVGIKGGYEGDFLIGKNFFIYGKGAFSSFVGRFELSQHSLPRSATGLFNYDLQNTFYRVKSNVELAMGITYYKMINKHLISFRAGYEFQKWWNMNYSRLFTRYNSTSPTIRVPNGDLTFNGFVFGINADF